jgi:predicted MPP superfamily phosphohydrolase
MYPVFLCGPSFLLSLALEAVGFALLRLLFPALRPARRFGWALACGLGPLVLSHAAWEWGNACGSYPMTHWGMVFASVGMPVLVLVVASLPLAAVVHRVAALVLLRSTRPTPVELPADQALLSRRTFVTCLTVAVPLAAASTALDGFALGHAPTTAPALTFRFPHLHPDLEGFTILQLSDLHLGISKQLGDLEQFLDRLASRRRPDLIVVTGDIADDLRQLAPALSLVHSFGARAGTFACLGNHEYLNDIRQTRPIIEQSRVPLLVDRGTFLSIGSARLFVAGLDDPVSMHANVRPALRNSLERAMRDSTDGAFRLLLAHRPEAFDDAARAGVDLTLSGHTHGGQIGYNGKSAFEPLSPDGYLWGPYRRGNAQLYTTSGFGHWFPFRLGCPTEAPLIELRSA